MRYRAARAALFLPAAAERSVELHVIRRTLEPRLDERALRAVVIALCDERAQVAVHTTSIAHVGELVAGLGRGGQRLLGLDLILERGAGDERIRNLAERDLDRLLVPRHLDAFVFVG